MQQIAFPLKLNSQGPDVANLQEGLFFLLNQNVINVGEANFKTYVLQNLTVEQSTQLYGETTASIIRIFQTSIVHSPVVTGDVDAATADRLNDILRVFSVLDADNQVTGQIYLDTGIPASNLAVRLYSKGIGDDPATLLKETTSDERGLN
jgi:hypothetical protein